MAKMVLLIGTPQAGTASVVQTATVPTPGAGGEERGEMRYTEGVMLDSHTGRPQSEERHARLRIHMSRLP